MVRKEKSGIFTIVINFKRKKKFVAKFMALKFNSVAVYNLFGVFFHLLPVNVIINSFLFYLNFNFVKINFCKRKRKKRNDREFLSLILTGPNK